MIARNTDNIDAALFKRLEEFGNQKDSFCGRFWIHEVVARKDNGVNLVLFAELEHCLDRLLPLFAPDAVSCVIKAVICGIEAVEIGG